MYANEKQEEVLELPSSYEVKGIVGNDRRHYALDLFRIFPPDANYMEVSEGSKIRHRMAVLRPELVETFHKSVPYVFCTYMTSSVLPKYLVEGWRIVERLLK